MLRQNWSLDYVRTWPINVDCAIRSYCTSGHHRPMRGAPNRRMIHSMGRLPCLDLSDPLRRAAYHAVRSWAHPQPLASPPRASHRASCRKQPAPSRAARSARPSATAPPATRSIRAPWENDFTISYGIRLLRLPHGRGPRRFARAATGRELGSQRRRSDLALQDALGRHLPLRQGRDTRGRHRLGQLPPWRRLNVGRQSRFSRASPTSRPMATRWSSRLKAATRTSRSPSLITTSRSMPAGGDRGIDFHVERRLRPLQAREPSSRACARHSRRTRTTGTQERGFVLGRRDALGDRCQCPDLGARVGRRADDRQASTSRLWG